MRVGTGVAIALGLALGSVQLMTGVQVLAGVGASLVSECVLDPARQLCICPQLPGQDPTDVCQETKPFG